MLNLIRQNNFFISSVFLYFLCITPSLFLIYPLFLPWFYSPSLIPLMCCCGLTVLYYYTSLSHHISKGLRHDNDKKTLISPILKCFRLCMDHQFHCFDSHLGKYIIIYMCPYALNEFLYKRKIYHICYKVQYLIIKTSVIHYIP